MKRDTWVLLVTMNLSHNGVTTNESFWGQSGLPVNFPPPAANMETLNLARRTFAERKGAPVNSVVVTFFGWVVGDETVAGL
jgi:hypothetical protein